MNYFNHSMKTARREWQRITGDRNIILILLFSPLMYVMFFGTIYYNKTETKVPIVVIDDDHSELSRMIVRNLNCHSLLRVERVEPDFAAATQAFNQLKVYGIVWIPSDFSRLVKSSQAAEIGTYINVSRFLIGNDINRSVTEVVGTIDAGIRIKRMETSGLSVNQTMNSFEPIRIDMRSLFVPPETYGDFLLPCLLVLILHQTLLFALLESIGREREQRTIGEWRKAGSGHIAGILTGKIVPYFLITFIYTLFFGVVFFRMFAIPIAGNAGLLLVMVGLWLIATLLFGLFMASFFQSKLQALSIGVFCSYPFFLLTGYTWPAFAMPQPLRWLSALFPTAPFLTSFQRIAVMNAGLKPVLPLIIHLALLCVLYAGLATLRYRGLFKRVERNRLYR